jgi:hypothetical protein
MSSNEHLSNLSSCLSDCDHAEYFRSVGGARVGPKTTPRHTFNAYP